MISEQLLFSVLQVATFIAAFALLILCMTMDRVKWWLPIPIYGLSGSCITTFLTTIYMREFTFDMVVVSFVVLAVAGVATAAHGYISPIAHDKREAVNKRVLYRILPVMSIFFLIWIVSATSQKDNGHFYRIEKVTEKIFIRQDTIYNMILTLFGKVNQYGEHQIRADSSAKIYRGKLDKKLYDIEQHQKEQDMKLIRMNLEFQKSNIQRGKK